MSGYTACACRDCFEIAIGTPGSLCLACRKAGCTPDNETECDAPHAYCSGGEDDAGTCEDCGEGF